jgi:RimJ/RimL family protein N-acetyltransferase
VKAPRVCHARYSDAKAIRKLFIDAEFVGNGEDGGYHIADVRAYIRRDFVIVVRYDNEIIAALWDTKYPKHLVGGGCAVRVDWQRMGIYKMMAEYRLAWAKRNGIHYLESSTVVGNQRMTNLFKRNGYVNEATIHVYTKFVK